MNTIRPAQASGPAWQRKATEWTAKVPRASCLRPTPQNKNRLLHKENKNTSLEVTKIHQDDKNRARTKMRGLGLDRLGLVDICLLLIFQKHKCSFLFCGSGDWSPRALAPLNMHPTPSPTMTAFTSKPLRQELWQDLQSQPLSGSWRSGSSRPALVTVRKEIPFSVTESYSENCALCRRNGSAAKG